MRLQLHQLVARRHEVLRVAGIEHASVFVIDGLECERDSHVSAQLRNPEELAPLLSHGVLDYQGRHFRGWFGRLRLSSFLSFLRSCKAGHGINIRHSIGTIQLVVIPASSSGTSGSLKASNEMPCLIGASSPSSPLTFTSLFPFTCCCVELASK